MTPETRDFFHWLSALIALPAAAYAGQPFFRSAWTALRIGRVNMDVPISLGVILALGMSVVETANHAEHAYFDSAIMLLFFLLCGRDLDHAMRRKTRAVAGNLAALKAEVAHRFEKNGEVVMVPVAALKPDDRLLVRPGERVPADGVVVGGNSEIDESLVTGETARRAVASGAAVHAGSLNFSGALTVRVTAAGADTLLAEVERLLEKAVAAKSRYLRLADRAARFYAPGRPHHRGADGARLARSPARRSTMPSSPPSPCSSSPAPARWRSPFRRSRWSRPARCSAAASSSTAATPSSGWPRSTRSCSTRPARSRCPSRASTTRPTSIPTVLELAARLALSSHHPLAAAVAREARDRTPIDDAIEEPGQGVRAMIDGREARLGSAVVLRHRRSGSAMAGGRDRHVADRLRARRPQGRARDSPDAAARRRCSGEGALTGVGYDSSASCQATGQRRWRRSRRRSGFPTGRRASSRPTRSRRSTR